MMATTSTEPNLYQLGLEIGGSPPFRMLGPYPDGSFVVTSTAVDEVTLQAALDAHVPDPQIQPPQPDPEPTTEDRVADLEAFIEALAAP